MIEFRPGLRALLCLGAPLLSAVDAHAAEDLAIEVADLAKGVVADHLLDTHLASLLVDTPDLLIARTQEYEVIDLADYSDPSTATVRLTAGAILLRDPSETGALVRYVHVDDHGDPIRHRDGRYWVLNGYRTADGRVAKILTNDDGEGVGTYTIDVVNGGYELNLDLDGDRVVDVQDSVTGTGREQLVMSALGRRWVEDYQEGYNALCFSLSAGGVPGVPGFGAGAASEAVLPGCGLQRSSSAGGFTGSLGDPAASGPTPIDQLCSQFAKDPGVAGSLRDAIHRGIQMDCEGDCRTEFNGCLLTCDGSTSGCVGRCQEDLKECVDQCASDVDAAGSTEAPPAEVEPAPPPPQTSDSRFHDTDADGHADAEDTDGDDVPDVSCADIGCGAEAYPNPYDGLRGEDWGAFCQDSPSPIDALEESATDCPAIDESKFTGLSDWFASCFVAPEEMSSTVWDMGTTHCEDQPEGCEPDFRESLRARFGALPGGATVSFWLDCGDKLVCQPGY